MPYLISDISDDTELLPVNASLNNPTYPLFYDLASETVKVLAGANTTEWQVARGVGNTQAVRHSRGTPLVLNASPYDGGGGVTASGAVIQRSATVSVNSGDPLPFNTVFEDSDGYFDAVGQRFVIPVGKAGLYAYGAKIRTAGTVGLTEMRVTLSVSGNAANGVVNGANYPAAGDPSFTAAATFIDVFAEGDTITPDWELNPLAAADMLGGVNGSTFFIAYLGALP